MKRPLFIFTVLFILAFMLIACGKGEDPAVTANNTVTTAAQTTAQVTAKSVINSEGIPSEIQSVLSGEATYTGTVPSRKYLLEKQNGTQGFDHDGEFYTNKYSVIDLDGDSVNEVILCLSIGTNEDYSSLILHVIDGKVYGYDRSYRAFNNIKTDGTFSYSNSASESGYAKLIFTESDDECKLIVHSEIGGYDSDGIPEIIYYKNDSIITEKDFTEELEMQSEKPDIVWKNTEFPLLITNYPF